MEVRGTVVVGRATEADLTVDDSAASRKHIEVSARGDAFVWRDLGSTNGTLLNGNRMLAGELKHGDRIQIGDSVLRFETEEVPEGPSDSKGGYFHDTIMESAGLGVRGETAERTTGLLDAVYQVIHEIATNYETCSLLDRILETTLGAIGAHRGAVFLAGPDLRLGPCPVCHQVHRMRDGVLTHAEAGEISISSTVAHRVLQDGECVLYQDTDKDKDFDQAESILALHIRSIVCVPLRAKHGNMGILYIDTDRKGKQYTQEDMLLAAAVGNSAGLALENAQMHHQLLEKQRMEQEIETAWTIQEGFLVKDWPEDEPRFEVYGETRPAKTVGGDFYDYVRLDENTVGLLIGDVSGKGVPAALTMAQSLAEFRLHARDYDSPAEVMRALNENLVKRSRRGLFCTLCYLRLNLETGEVICANAGHPPVVRIGRAGVSTFGDASGPPAGVLAGLEWEDTRQIIDPGDALLLYTDGIVEARRAVTLISNAESAAPQEYGLEGLCLLAATQYGAAPRTLVAAVQEDVRRYCAPEPPHDDCTMAALRYTRHA